MREEEERHAANSGAEDDDLSESEDNSPHRGQSLWLATDIYCPDLEMWLPKPVVSAPIALPDRENYCPDCEMWLQKPDVSAPIALPDREKKEVGNPLRASGSSTADQAGVDDDVRELLAEDRLKRLCKTIWENESEEDIQLIIDVDNQDHRDCIPDHEFHVFDRIRINAAREHRTLSAVEQVDNLGQRSLGGGRDRRMRGNTPLLGVDTHQTWTIHLEADNPLGVAAGPVKFGISGYLPVQNNEVIESEEIGLIFKVSGLCPEPRPQDIGRRSSSSSGRGRVANPEHAFLQVTDWYAPHLREDAVTSPILFIGGGTTGVAAVCDEMPHRFLAQRHRSQQPLEFNLLHCPGCGNRYSSDLLCPGCGNSAVLVRRAA